MDRRQFLASSLLAVVPPLPRAAFQVKDLLSERFPRLATHLPRLPLVNRPSPVEHAARLGMELALPELYVKRDDLLSATYTGSKARKLEYLLGQARALGCSRVVTGGSLGSHHALATAIHGSAHGFSVELLLLPEPPSLEVRRVLTATAHHAQVIRYVPTANDLPRLWRESEAQAPGNTYSIPLGGTSPLGNVAYIEAALELEQQVEGGILPEPETIYLPLGTMGCAVGILIGLRLTRLKSRLVAVRTSNPSTSSPQMFRQLYTKTLDWLRSVDPAFPELNLDEQALIIDGQHLGPGYAIATAEGRRVMAMARDCENLQLELTYTAKAMAAVAADRRRLGASPVLFWNTHAGDAPTCPPRIHGVPRELLAYLRSSGD